MLTIYEQIQAAIDLTEGDLTKLVRAKDAAESAGMSLRSFHRYFPALTGYRFAEYQRRRRMSRAASQLRTGEASLLAIAIDVGYDSHEAFTRAFKNEFGITPSQCRTSQAPAHQVGAIDLVGEVKMGVLTKSLSPMTVVVFDGFKPEPETTAFRKMEAWMELHPEAISSHRVFGHNIDANGALAHDPDNLGYRLMVTIPATALPLDDDARVGTIEGGNFVVTGIEGSFEDDPSGSWVTVGWQRLQEMVKRNNLHTHPSRRWFEEVLEPVEPGNMRLDLYAELE